MKLPNLRLFHRDRDNDEDKELSAATLRGLLEVREEVRKARAAPDEMLATLISIGDRDLRPNEQSHQEPVPAPAPAPTPAPASIVPAVTEDEGVVEEPAVESAAIQELDTAYLIRLMEGQEAIDSEQITSGQEGQETETPELPSPKD